jgi:hypothetical protein
MQQFVGEGGLESRNAIQLLHKIFSLYFNCFEIKVEESHILSLEKD